jgi:hypothetical protein
MANALLGKVLRRDHIGVPFAESVANFVEYKPDIALLIRAEIHGQRVEDVAKDPWITQQAHPHCLGIETGLFNLSVYPAAQSTPSAITMIPVVEREHAGAIVAEEPHALRQTRQRIEIEVQSENPVTQPVRLWAVTSMDDLSGIYGGIPAHSAATAS